MELEWDLTGPFFCLLVVLLYGGCEYVYLYTVAGLDMDFSSHIDSNGRIPFTGPESACLAGSVLV